MSAKPRVLRAVTAFGRLSPARRGLFIDAVLTLSLVTVAIRLLPFRTLMRLAEWPLGHERSGLPRADRLGHVRWAVLLAARWVPWRAVCLHQSLTAQILLRRRGVPSVLYYGANAGDSGGMKAHAWVASDGFDVIGGESAADFAVLTTYPRT